MRILIASLFTLLGFMGFSQNYYSTVGSTAVSMGGAGVASADLWSVNNNQAGLASIEKFEAGFFYSNNFMLKALSQNAALVAIPTKSGSFGLSLNYFGYKSYNNKKIGIAYGRKLSEKISVGVQLDYLNTYIADNYGNGNFFTFEIGFIAKLNKKINLGAHVFNPIMVKLNDYQDERIPAILNLGVEYRASQKFRALLEVESDIYNSPIFKAGAEYMATDMLFIRAGLSNNPNIYSFGFGLKINTIKLEFSSTMHQILGYSPQFSFVYCPRTSKK